MIVVSPRRPIQPITHSKRSKANRLDESGETCLGMVLFCKYILTKDVSGWVIEWRSSPSDCKLVCKWQPPFLWGFRSAGEVGSGRNCS